MTDLASLAAAFSRLQVLVIGDAMLDRYVRGESTRLSPEAAVPVVTVEGCDAYAGGAANVAANAAALGAKVTLVAPLGDDPAGASLARLIEGHGVELERTSVVAGRRTLTKTRIAAGETPVCRLDDGDTTSPETEQVQLIIGAIRQRWATASVVVLSDYGYGGLSPLVRGTVEALQRESPLVLAVDSRDLTLYRRCGPTLVKPNLAEANRLLAGACDAAEHPESAVHRLRELTGATCVALTLGASGAVVSAGEGGALRTSARPVAQSRAAGAGDCYLAAFSLVLGAGGCAGEAAEVAACAAQIATAKDGTAVCALDDLLEAVAGSDRGPSSEQAVLRRVAAAREEGRRVVFTNGVFDLLHAGHVRYLTAARALGDLLVVAINSDASVRRLKGPDRPVNGVGERAAVLAGLGSVDAVVVFEERTPDRLIRAIRPDVYVKGGDYTREQLPEASLVEALGGTVVLIDHDGNSTTRLIERLRSSPPSERRRTRSGRGPQGSHR